VPHQDNISIVAIKVVDPLQAETHIIAHGHSVPVMPATQPLSRSPASLGQGATGQEATARQTNPPPGSGFWSRFRVFAAVLMAVSALWLASRLLPGAQPTGQSATSQHATPAPPTAQNGARYKPAASEPSGQPGQTNSAAPASGADGASDGNQSDSPGGAGGPGSSGRPVARPP